MESDYKPYLIQRGKFEAREGKTGIDSIIRFDYMGAAEFEWGALPQSLKRMREAKESYAMYDLKLISSYTGKEVIITVYSKREDDNQIPTILKSLVNPNVHVQLKGYCDLHEHFKPAGERSKWCNNFWWDVDGDYMFWPKNKPFELEFKKVM